MPCTALIDTRDICCLLFFRLVSAAAQTASTCFAPPARARFTPGPAGSSSYTPRGRGRARSTARGPRRGWGGCERAPRALTVSMTVIIQLTRGGTCLPTFYRSFAIVGTYEAVWSDTVFFCKQYSQAWKFDSVLQFCNVVPIYTFFSKKTRTTTTLMHL